MAGRSSSLAAYIVTLMILIHTHISQAANTGCGLPESFAGSCDKDVIPDTYSVTQHVLPGTKCRLSGAVRVMLCNEDSTWTHEFDVRKQTAITRQKRQVAAIIMAVTGLITGIGQVVCMFVCKKSPPPNAPPTITCPRVSDEIAETGKTTAHVTWAQPTAEDPEDGSKGVQLIAGKDPGSEFDEGAHFIQYKTQDNGGLTASCTIQFNVKVQRCSPIHWPSTGRVECDKREISGSKCKLYCDEGYEPDGATESVCNKETWSTSFKCTEKECPTIPNVTNGNIYCMGNPPTYKTMCTLSCKRGYSTEGPPMIICNKKGEFSPPGKCIDTKPPEFIDGCPPDVEEYAEQKGGARVVSWADPATKDNSGVAPTVKGTPSTGHAFTLGRTPVHIVATDQDGNTASCTFTVNIKTLVCDDPKLDKSGRDLLMYTCSDGMTYGDSCTMSCKSGYPLEGSSRILCNKRLGSGTPPRVHWTWPDDTLEPYCKINKCPDLNEPLNGALACDRWNHGKMCQMQCNEKFDVPRTVPAQYVCGESDGMWRPSDNIQDCTVKRRPGSMNMPSELYYYSGDCPDDAANKQIRENFIKMLKANPLFKEECGGTVPDCRAEFVSVKCGAISGRKRDANVNVKVEFNVILPYRENGQNTSVVVKSYETAFDRIKGAIDKAVQSKSLDVGVPGLELQDDSYAPGIPNFYCGKGMTSSYGTASCAGCPSGTLYNETADSCADCPLGSYQDSGFASMCLRCPDGFSTKSTGSRRKEECLAMCEAGWSSGSGLLPCSPCPVGTFQEMRGMTACKSCPVGQSTLNQGTNSIQNCEDFDIFVTKSKSGHSGTVKADLASLSMFFWIKIQGNGSLKVEISDEHDAERFHVNIADTIMVRTGSGLVDSGLSARKNDWMHIITTVDTSTKELTIYIGGKQAFTKVLNSIASPMVLNGSTVSLTSDTKATVSSFNILGRMLTSSEVVEVASGCGVHVHDSSFEVNPEGLIVPSTCDSVNECMSSPCGNHTCVNEVGRYRCDCSHGYSGRQCEVPPDHCLHHSCQHGARCVNDYSNYTCVCGLGYRGRLCEEVIVNGGWSLWSDWGECSVTCGGGVMTRNRKCSSPSPDPDGKPCEGAETLSDNCNAHECPACRHLLRSYGVETHCNTTDDLIQCSISCRDDLMFVKPVLPLYECGRKTNYTWTHQTDDNPHARLPACSAVASARGYSIHHQVEYPSLSCDTTEQTKSSLTTQLLAKTNTLKCIEDNSCQTRVEFCPGTSRRKRSTGAPVTIVMTSNNDSVPPMNISLVFSDKSRSGQLKAYFTHVATFEISAQQLVNNSKTIFTVNLGGRTYTVDPSSGTTAVDINCPPGTIPTDAAGLCGECPAGSREENNVCVLCGKGSYQNHPASMTCTPCPSGTTTPGLGATSDNDCSTDGDHFSPSSDVEDSTNTTLAIVLPTVIALVLIAVVIVVAFKVKSTREKRSGSTVWPKKDKVDSSPLPPPYTPSHVVMDPGNVGAAWYPQQTAPSNSSMYPVKHPPQLDVTAE
ncbi:sushi, von Willebrand factor type A, EGF and pentraxin domain-containing protein 1-like [Haliotis rufescens]|uniref:sushi, von Willebrand factor type A, EGF and pentraxin domain-containing protein 1-like n=1 Tax=Haliotis rufescens TaxID=6454 RepID=UPI00201E805D|nr:sushi, von Willebrand factor type A, EGF and pentraxin domain-containing protein 1-like [Haliotis rufescens]